MFGLFASGSRSITSTAASSLKSQSVSHDVLSPKRRPSKLVKKRLLQSPKTAEKGRSVKIADSPEKEEFGVLALVDEQSGNGFGKVGDTCFRCDIYASNAKDHRDAENECKQLVLQAGGQILSDMVYPGGFCYTINLKDASNPLVDGDETVAGGHVRVSPFLRLDKQYWNSLHMHPAGEVCTAVAEVPQTWDGSREIGRYRHAYRMRFRTATMNSMSRRDARQAGKAFTISRQASPEESLTERENEAEDFDRFYYY